MGRSGLPLLGASEAILLGVARTREPRQRGQTWFPVPMQGWHDQTVKGKGETYEVLESQKRGPRGEEDCPTRRLRERHWVVPLERGGDLDVIDFLSGSGGMKKKKKRKEKRCIEDVEDIGTLLRLHFILSWLLSV